MNAGVVPVTGLTLPLVSAGGSSVLALLAGVTPDLALHYVRQVMFVTAGALDAIALFGSYYPAIFDEFSLRSDRRFGDPGGNSCGVAVLPVQWIDAPEDDRQPGGRENALIVGAVRGAQERSLLTDQLCDQIVCQL